jgi:hypothetical protein
MKKKYLKVYLLMASVLFVFACDKDKDPADKITSYIEHVTNLADPADCDGSAKKMKSYFQNNKKDLESAIITLIETNNMNNALKKIDPVRNKALPKLMTFVKNCESAAMKLGDTLGIVERLK